MVDSYTSGMEFYYDSTKEVGNRIVAMYVKDGNNLIKINLEQEYLVTTQWFHRSRRRRF